MSATGTMSVVGFAPQPQKYGDFEYLPDLLTWYKVPVAKASIAIQQDIQAYPIEADGELVGKGMYKQGIAFAGDMDLLPRAGGVLGYLLHAALGNVVTTADSPVAGVNKHIFQYASDKSALPWMSFRRLINGTLDDGTAVTEGEIGLDCKIQRLQIMINAKGTIAMTVSLFGLDGKRYLTPTTWVYSNTEFDAVNTVPISNNASITLSGERFDVRSIMFDITNNLSTPDEEQVAGSYRAKDITVKSRSCTIRAMLQYRNGNLNSQMFSGSRSGTDFSPAPFETKTIGAIPAFEALVDSPAFAVGETPFRLGIRGNDIIWTPGRPVEIVPSEITQMEIVGTFTSPASGQYVEVELNNTNTAYTFPVKPTLVLGASSLTWSTPYNPLLIASTGTVTSTLGIGDLDGGKIMAFPAYGGNPATTSFAYGAPELAAIGAIDGVNDGTAGLPLQVNLSALATPALVQAFLRTITMDDSSPVAGWRAVRVLLYMGDGSYAVKDREINVS